MEPQVVVDAFDSSLFLDAEGPGRRLVEVLRKTALFNQGADANYVFYLRSGRAKLTIVTEEGREATVALLGAGDFMGETTLTRPGSRHLTTATAVTNCRAMRIEREEMVRVLREEQVFSEFFRNFLLQRGIRVQADFVDQLLNSSERRLARTLLLMLEAEPDDQDGPAGEGGLIPEITQEALAELVGTTRSRVSFFMNRFRRRGMIEYSGRIRIHKELLQEFLQGE